MGASPSRQGAGVGRHRGQPHGRDDRPGPHQAQAGLLPGLRGPAGAPPPVAPWRGGATSQRCPPPACSAPPEGCGEGSSAAGSDLGAVRPAGEQRWGWGVQLCAPPLQKEEGLWGGGFGVPPPGLYVRPGGGRMLVFGEKCNKNGFPPAGGSSVWSPPTPAPKSPHPARWGGTAGGSTAGWSWGAPCNCPLPCVVAPCPMYLPLAIAPCPL